MAGPPRAGRSPRSPLVQVPGLLLAAGLAHQAYFAFVAPPPRLHPLRFERASLIAAPVASPLARFRHELVLADAPRHAWIKLAAREAEVRLYVDGRAAGASDGPRRLAALVVDLGAALRPGRNVIAVEVERATWPAAPELLVEGEVVGRAGGRVAFASGEGWSWVGPAEAQAGRAPGWLEAGFPGGRPVQVGASAPHAFAHATALPEAAITAPPPERWLLPPPPAGRTPGGAADAPAALSATLTVTRATRAVVLRVGAAETYRVRVNGRLAAEGAPFARSRDLVDLRRALGYGLNRIEVSPQALAGPPSAVADLVVAAGGREQVVALAAPGWASVPGPPPGQLLAQPIAAGTPPSLLLLRAALLAGLTLALGLAALVITRLAGEAVLAPVLPSLLVLAGLHLAAHDHRVDPALPYRLSMLGLVAAPAAALAAAWLLTRGRAAPAAPAEARPAAALASPRRRAGLALAVGLAALGLAAVSLGIRLASLDVRSLYHDEVTMVVAADQVLTRGYPLRQIGWLEKPLTTYEALPYPIALSMVLFGRSEWSVRLPAALAGALTTALLFLLARHLWGSGAGLLAALVHAFHPSALLWGRIAFHPSQAQLLALAAAGATLLAAEKAGVELERRWLAAAAALFLLTYLTWEGTGLLLPALLLVLLVERGFARLLRDRGLWAAGAVVALVVALQLARRVLANVPYLVVGQPPASQDVRLRVFDPLFDPWFYADGFLLSAAHVVLTAAAAAGLLLVGHDRGLRAALLLLSLPLLLLTTILASTSTRYAYFLQPFLILAAVGTVARATRAARAASASRRVAGWAARCFAFGLPLLLWAATNDRLLALHRLGSEAGEVTQGSPETIGIDYRGAARAVEARLEPGDVVIALMPHAFQFYTGRRADYFLQPYTDRQVFYDVTGLAPGMMDKYVGSRVLRDAAELAEVLARHRRVWFLATPYAAYLLSSDEPTRRLVEQARAVHEGANARVYLWER